MAKGVLLLHLPNHFLRQLTRYFPAPKLSVKIRLNILKMKTLKNLVIFVIVAISMLNVKAQLPANVSQLSFFTTKFTKEKVYNVQRQPEFPTIGNDWTLIKTGAALEVSGNPIDWGTNRYVMFVAEAGLTDKSNLLEDNVFKTGSKYSVSLKLFESNGTFVKVISKYGDIIGIAQQAFVYNEENRFALYFSQYGVNNGNIKYKPTIKIVTKLSELLKPNEVIKPVELPKTDAGIAEIIKINTTTTFFTSKYSKDKAWDVQRSPAFPVANQEWILSQPQSAMDPKRANIDWGNGRYLRFVINTTNVNAANALTDDVYKSGAKYNLSLQLFESNGKLVNVVSNWGKIRGLGTQGFLYEAEGDVGTFFTSYTVTSSSVIKYKPSLTEVTKLSELIKPYAINTPVKLPEVKPEEKPGSAPKIVNPAIENKLPRLPDVNTGLDIFNTKFSKNQVWEADGLTDDLKDGETLTLTVKGPVQREFDGGQQLKNLDWGKNGDRYMMFVVVKESGRIEIADDIKNDDPTYISVNLYERNGTLVDKPYNCGSINALSNNCVVYGVHATDYGFNILFSANAVKMGDVITYKPTLAQATRLSQITKGPVVTQLDQLKKILPVAGGKSMVAFNPKVTYGTMTDQDGNTYKTVTIGTQTWMAENLRVTKYRDGTPIPIVNMHQDWSGNLTTGACCSYNNSMDKNFIATYGLMYNWYAAVDKHNIAPAGWHVPTDAEWTTLITTLGGEKVAGGKMKESGTSHWKSPNAGATNESGFSAVGASERGSEEGKFSVLNGDVVFWSATKKKDQSAWSFLLNSDDPTVFRSDNDPKIGFSVRLIKD